MGYGEEVMTDKRFIKTEFQKNICNAPDSTHSIKTYFKNIIKICCYIINIFSNLESTRSLCLDLLLN